MKTHIVTAAVATVLLVGTPLVYADRGGDHEGRHGGRDSRVMTIDDAVLNNLLVDNGQSLDSEVRIKRSGHNGERVRIEVRNSHEDEDEGGEFEDEFEDDSFDFSPFFSHGSSTFTLPVIPVVPTAPTPNATATREMLQMILPAHTASTTNTYGDAINSLAGYKTATQNIARYITASTSANASFSSSLVATIDQMISSLSPLGVSNTISTPAEKSLILQKLDDVSENVRALYRAVLLSLQ